MLQWVGRDLDHPSRRGLCPLLRMRAEGTIEGKHHGHHRFDRRDELGVDRGLLPAPQRGRARAFGWAAFGRRAAAFGRFRRDRGDAGEGRLGRGRRGASRKRASPRTGRCFLPRALHQHHAQGRRSDHRRDQAAIPASRRRDGTGGAGVLVAPAALAGDAFHHGTGFLSRPAQGLRCRGAGAAPRGARRRPSHHLRGIVPGADRAGLARALPRHRRTRREGRGRRWRYPRLHRDRPLAVAGRCFRASVRHNSSACPGALDFVDEWEVAAA